MRFFSTIKRLKTRLNFLTHLKEYFHAINEEKYDHNKHKECITSIKNMGVKMHVFMTKPY